MYFLFVFFYVLFVYKYVLLPPGVNPIAVKYIISNDTMLTFCFMASIFERRRFPRLPVHPAANSGPSEVSAVKECLVPRFDSKMNPGRSSRKIVACYRKKNGNI